MILFKKNCHQEFEDFPNLSMLYLHRNNIEDFDEVNKLQKLKSLRTLTLNNNPMCIVTNFRNTVIQRLPDLRKLDNVVIVKSERESAKSRVAPRSTPQRQKPTTLSEDVVTSLNEFWLSDGEIIDTYHTYIHTTSEILNIYYKNISL